LKGGKELGLNLSTKQKTAILMISLPPEVSTQIMREFSKEERDEISAEIAKLTNVSNEIRAAVVEEFFDTHIQPSLSGGAIGGGMLGTNFASQLLEEGIKDTTEESKKALPPLEDKKNLGFLNQVEPRDIVQLLKSEHPQTIALVISFLDTTKASAVLAQLSPSLQAEVARRLAEINRVEPEVLAEIEKVLYERLDKLLNTGQARGVSDGKEVLVEILSKADKQVEERILSALTRKSPVLVKDLKSKLCDFDDLANITDEGLKEVIRLAETRDLVLALKGSSSQIVNRVFRCMPPESARALKEDIEALGPVDSLEIKAAQQEIRNILRGLVTLGKVRFQ